MGYPHYRRPSSGVEYLFKPSLFTNNGYMESIQLIKHNCGNKWTILCVKNVLCSMFQWNDFETKAVGVHLELTPNWAIASSCYSLCLVKNISSFSVMMFVDKLASNCWLSCLSQLQRTVNMWNWRSFWLAWKMCK